MEEFQLVRNMVAVRQRVVGDSNQVLRGGKNPDTTFRFAIES